jgi:iron complex outermembrane receptor protein
MNGMGQNNESLNATDFPIPDYQLLDVGAFLYLKCKYKKYTLSGGVRLDNRYLSC